MSRRESDSSGQLPDVASTGESMGSSDITLPANFMRAKVESDLATGRIEQVVTRFPPEPNGFLHIGHAKSICLNFGLADSYGGLCHLRFDDTNPSKEDQAYIDAIEEDVRWLGFQWNGPIRFASHYFEQLFEWALHLIDQGFAYVCDLNAEEASRLRGSLTSPGQNSPYRDRSPQINRDLFLQMRAGDFADGARTLRAKIDMSSPNINMRDPILYRIRHVRHHQTGNQWCIYPSYDFAHGQSDAIEGITHSICTLEFEDHRPLYEWLLDHLPVPNKPKQYEFARLNLSYTITSKRKLKQLVDEGHVTGWDDPRMSTLSGFRRRGYTSHAIKRFCDIIGVNRAGGLVDLGMLEHCIREDLDAKATRAFAILRPLKVVITNWPEENTQDLQLAKHPKTDMGVRTIKFAREIYIDQSDFMENPPKGYKRLEPGGEVRLRGAYIIRAEKIIKNAAGEVTELRCTYDADTLGKNPEGRKVKGVIQWVPVHHCIEAEVRLYDRLFNTPTPEKSEDGAGFLEHLNPNSLRVLKGCRLEPSLQDAQGGETFQFEREGYFHMDPIEWTTKNRVFNLTVGLRDTWSGDKT